MFEYDRSSKWLIEHHGDAILRIAGVEEIESWRALILTLYVFSSCGNREEGTAMPRRYDGFGLTPHRVDGGHSHAPFRDHCSHPRSLSP